MVKNFGIRTMGFFMVGNPEETKESVRKTIEFAKDLGLDFIQVCRTIPKPGTELDKLMIKKTGRDYWRDYVLGKKIQKRIPAPWIDLREEELGRLTKHFYLNFYFRLEMIFNRLLQLKSVSELIRYIKVAMKMIFCRTDYEKVDFKNSNCP